MFAIEENVINIIFNYLKNAVDYVYVTMITEHNYPRSG